MKKYISENMCDYEVYTLLKDRFDNPLIQFLAIDQTIPPALWGKMSLSYPGYKINVFLKGDFNVIIGDNVTKPVYGDICILRPNEIHIGQIPYANHLEYFELVIMESAFESLDSKASELLSFIQKRNDNFLQLTSSITERIIDYCRQMTCALQENRPESSAIAYAYTLLILDLMNRHAQHDLYRSRRSSLPEELVNAIRYIDEYYTTQLTLNDIAASVNVSVSYLIRRFKNAIGLTPYQYIQKRRIEHAKVLLVNGATVSDACYKSGFSNCSYFISVFKEITGVTPKQYKEKQSLYRT